MWRFIIASFAFLGWSFYVLSGGADYEPRTQSIQARKKLDDVRPQARHVAIAEVGQPAEASAEAPAEEVIAAETATAIRTDEDEAVARALTSLDSPEVGQTDDLQVTLASVSSEEIVEPQFESDPVKVDTLTELPDLPLETVLPPVDIRSVTGTDVNMRDGPSTFYLVIGRLGQGDAVEVLENPGDGWLKIRVAATGQEGWLADWLVTAAAN